MTDEFSSAEKDLIYRVIRARRDIRKFVPTPIPPDALLRILEAAHAAPSVGFVQPWNFILIDSVEVRERIKQSFEAVNALESGKVNGTERGELYKSLKLEGIMESPLNIAITCDHSRGGAFVLGKAPMPVTGPYSVCLAIENLWLSARAEGIGVGWVSIFDKLAVENILGLPEGVELVAYLCVGYPVEFRPTPMLEEVGWKKRDLLKTLIFQNHWGTPGVTDAGQETSAH